MIRDTQYIVKRGALLDRIIKSDKKLKLNDYDIIGLSFYKKKKIT